MYELFKTLHVLGVILLVGNVTVSAVWKVFANRTRNPEVIAFAQRLITITDWSLTLAGIVLIIAGGYGASISIGQHPFATNWLVIGQMLFGVSGAIWAGILVPLQIRQARTARGFRAGGRIPEQYWTDSRRWLFWGIVATVPLVAAVYVMVTKP